MDVKCEVCGQSLDVVFSQRSSNQGKPAFISERKYPIGFRVFIPRGVAIIDRYEVESVHKHEFGWIHYLKEQLKFP